MSPLPDPPPFSEGDLYEMHAQGAPVTEAATPDPAHAQMLGSLVAPPFEEAQVTAEVSVLYAVRAKTLRAWTWHPDHGKTSDVRPDHRVDLPTVGFVVLPGTFGVVMDKDHTTRWPYALTDNMRFEVIRWQVAYSTDSKTGPADETNVSPTELEFVSGVLQAVAFDRPPGVKAP